MPNKCKSIPEHYSGSLLKNFTKSAVGNFPSALYARGELIISLVVPRGFDCLVKISIPVFFHFCQVTRSASSTRIFFKVIANVAEAFCCSSSFSSMAAPVQPNPAALAAFQAVQNPDLQVPAEQQPQAAAQC